MKCKACGGHGRVYPQLGPVYNCEHCPSCHGTGVEPPSQIIELKRRSPEEMSAYWGLKYAELLSLAKDMESLMLVAIFVNVFLTFFCIYLAICKASYDAILIASTIYLLAHSVGFSASALVNQIKMK